jgi:hypothetical protein
MNRQWPNVVLAAAGEVQLRPVSPQTTSQQHSQKSTVTLPFSRSLSEIAKVLRPALQLTSS